MPNYRTHSIHGEVILPKIDKKVEISDEDIKSFCIGPDSLITTDYKVFDLQHANKVREYFTTMLKLIKKNKLQNNSEVMAFLYGQVDHYILDIVMHPLIYYATEDEEALHIFKPHGLVENWMDDYVIKKYGKDEKKYYRKMFLSNTKLKNMVNKLYEKVYDRKNESLKYSLGILNTHLFDTLIRRNGIKLAPLLIKLANVGDIMYDDDFDRVLPYLNLDNKTWFNPETGEEYSASFDDLWDKSIDDSLETIDDINGYLYKDKKLSNRFISNDISFNTGLPCSDGQSFQYIKRKTTFK